MKNNKIKAVISSVGAYIPDYILTNQELEKMVDTSDEWITKRTGIKERRILKEKRLGTSDMAVKAVNIMCEKRGISPAEIDLLICATATPDYQFPATASIICDKIGAINAWSFDLMAACSGFIFAIFTASKMIESSKYKKIVVVGADKMSSIINYEDRTTCVIFGDGAGAVLLEPNDEGFGIIDAILKTDGSGRPYLYQKAGGSVNPASIETVLDKEHYVYQEGKAVFKYAVTKMADVSVRIMERNNLKPDDIAWLVPHQANKRIINATAKRMGIGMNKVMLNLHKYGNTTNAAIPLCLWEYEDKLKKGDNVIFSAFGAGFSWGAVYLKWYKLY